MILRYKAEDEIEVLKVLTQEFKLSRRRISALKREGGIRADDRCVFTNYMLKRGELLQVIINKRINENIIPQNIGIEVVYEDEYLCVVNKPPHMPVHPCRGYTRDTLANALMYLWQERGEESSFHAVSRLDMDTSGLVTIAKNGHIHKLFEGYMLTKAITRRYFAIVEGFLEGDNDIIDAPIARLQEGKVKRGVREDGKVAITKYKVVERKKDITLAELELLTGRTHQIRVHMSHIGHPLVGDWLYNETHKATGDTATNINRQMLHAWYTSFKHPITGEVMEFKCPMPDDMVKVLEGNKYV